MAATPPIWSEKATCDFCEGVVRREGELSTEGRDIAQRREGAVLYDAATKQGPWAAMCETHFKLFSRNMLGAGFGQKYVCDGNRNFVKVEG